jgi:hypothetical protein
MSAPYAGERRYGPYCACRYAGRPDRPHETEVWLLYDGAPFPDDRPVVGVLYNRPEALLDPERSDRWLARPHASDHKGNEVEGLTEEEAVEKLWKKIRGSAGTDDAYKAEVANAHSATPECGSGCS